MWWWKTTPKNSIFSQEKQAPKENFMQNKDPSPLSQLQPQNCHLWVNLERLFRGKDVLGDLCSPPTSSPVFLTLEKKKKSDFHENLTSLLWENPDFFVAVVLLWDGFVGSAW